MSAVNSLPPWGWSAALAWTLAMALVWIWGRHHTQMVATKLTTMAARVSSTQHLLNRHWITQYGGVYVPVTDQIVPSPHLSHLPERDVTTPSGKQLTLVNPATLPSAPNQDNLPELRIRLTSRNPFRQTNTPDPWEERGLTALAKGTSELASVEVLEGEPHLRLLRPLHAEQSCLECHSGRGYQPGQIMGGVSVSLPLRVFEDAIDPHARAELAGYSVIWVLGLGLIGLAGNQAANREKDRNHAEAALRQNETRLRSVIENLPAGAAVCMGEEIRLNRAAEEIIGASPGEVQTLDQWFHFNFGERASEIRARYEQNLASGFPRSRSVPILRKDGSRREIQFAGAAVPGSNLVIWVMHDVTEQRQAEDALRSRERLLREQEQQYRMLANSGLALIWTAGPDGLVNYVNEPWLRFTGRTLEEELGHRWAEGVHPDDVERCLKTFREAFAMRLPFDMEYRLRHHSGNHRWVRDLGSPNQNTDGEFIGYIGHCFDITREKELESQYLQAQRLDAIGQLAGGVAHDFNNIVASFLIHLRLLKDEPQMPHEARECLTELEMEARRAGELARQLLLFGRRQAMQQESINLSTLVENLTRMLRRLLGEQISLTMQGLQDETWVKADRGMIEQVITNLCLNARDAMPKGGDLRIRVQEVAVDESHKDRWHEARAGRFACLTITDTGCGMDVSILGRIFEPFFTTKPVGAGSGLGLATVSGIVKQHLGWVEVESATGQGTTFRVYLPAITQSTEATSGKPLQKRPAAGQETLLLVEDEDCLRRATAQMLRRSGYAVIEARNGVEALKIWETHKQHVKLLFTDMVMPEVLSGLELAKRLRNEAPELPVIISSGYSSELLAEDVTDSYITYIPKPCGAEELLALVREVLDRKALA